MYREENSLDKFWVNLSTTRFKLWYHSWPYVPELTCIILCSLCKLNRALESYAILERGIKNWPISRTGYHFECKFFLKRGPNLETRAAHTHPKYSKAIFSLPTRATILTLSQNIDLLIVFQTRLNSYEKSSLSRKKFACEYWNNRNWLMSWKGPLRFWKIRVTFPH